MLYDDDCRFVYIDGDDMDKTYGAGSVSDAQDAAARLS